LEILGEALVHTTCHALLKQPDKQKLASDAASYVTGAILLVDGGYTCW